MRTIDELVPLLKKLRLSGVLQHSQWGDATGGQATLWLNPQAKHPLPASEEKALLRCLMPAVY